MSVYEMIRASMSATVPFAKHTGIELSELDEGRAVAVLTQGPQTSNHMGSIHAGAIFTLAETAAGGAVAGAFAPFMLNMKAFPTDMAITLHGRAEQRITAEAEIITSVERLRTVLRASGKVRFGNPVKIHNEDGSQIASFTSDWQVKLRNVETLKQAG